MIVEKHKSKNCYSVYKTLLGVKTEHVRDFETRYKAETFAGVTHFEPNKGS